MLVIEHTGYGRGGRYRIASYTIPRATGRPVFFMQHGGGHKCHGRVPGRERMIVRTIRTGDILPQVDKGARLELSFRWVKVLVWEKVVP